MQMSLWPKVILVVAALTGVSLIGVLLAAPQASSQGKAQTSDQVFKNVQVLKGIPVDDFMDTMGLMSAAVGYDCSECHLGAGTEKVNWAADNGRKIIARKMVTMVAAINRDNFQGRQVVTCWSCHHGRDRPSTTPALENVYGPVLLEMDDALVQMPGQPTSDVIIDKYIQALGGAEKLAALKSYIARHQRRVRRLRRRGPSPPLREISESAHHAHSVCSGDRPRR